MVVNQAKADPAKDLRDGSHCLSVAVTESTVPVVEELLKFVPSVDSRDTRGYTALLKVLLCMAVGTSLKLPMR